MKRVLASVIFLYGSYIPIAAAVDTAEFWKDLPTGSSVSTRSATKTSSMAVIPSSYRAVTLDLGRLRRELAGRMLRGPATLALPLPEGGMTYFTLSESDVMPNELAARYPELKSYKGVDDQGRHVRVDITPLGLQAEIYNDKNGVWLVQTATQLQGEAKRASAQGDMYWSFQRSMLPPSSVPFYEKEDMLNNMSEFTKKIKEESSGNGGNMRSGGAVIYDYRLAMAATSSYTKSFGGSVLDGLASVVTMVNRINEIYENDLGVHLTLIPEEDKIIYTDPKTDPYDGLEPGGGEINRKNVINLARVIGNEAFDVGHVVAGSGGGGRANIASTCTDLKASGSTGRPNPVGDVFVVDYVAHELGHSFGSYHVFNARRSTPEAEAVEPGEGSTIMGYAGVLGGVYSYQKQSDPYFNGSSLRMIQDWVTGPGGMCAKRTLNRGAAPWLDPASLVPPDAFYYGGRAKYTIPARTPFTLDVAVTKGTGNNLTYTWEQFDFGPEQRGILKDNGQGPIFRSFKPHAESIQTFPSLAAVLGDEPLGNGQVYPNTTRKLSFRVTIRDNVPMSAVHGLAANTTSGQTYLDVLDTGGAFEILNPRARVTVKKGSSLRVDWRVAETNVAPISCGKVKLDLSLDGGYTYLSKPLKDKVDNVGYALVNLPMVTSDKARIRVSCKNNVFFAVTPTNISITP